jgi:DNA mismatch endonuclease (patch repair protein)
MSRIRGKGNKDTEIALAKLLRGNGITGWRRHQPVLGRPDFIFPKVRLAVFVDGCFWHGCPIHSNPAKWLNKSSMPSSCNSRRIRARSRSRTGRVFWTQKLAGNMARDRFVTRTLRKQGWRVVRIWEHDLARNPQRCLRRLELALR